MRLILLLLQFLLLWRLFNNFRFCILSLKALIFNLGRLRHSLNLHVVRELLCWSRRKGRLHLLFNGLVLTELHRHDDAEARALHFFFGVLQQRLKVRLWQRLRSLSICLVLDLAHVNVVLEAAFLDLTGDQSDSAEAMLNTHLPVTLVVTTVSPKHLAVAMTLVHVVAANVVVSRLPIELTLAVLLVVVVLACILIAILILIVLLPFSFAMLHTLTELSYV